MRILLVDDDTSVLQALLAILKTLPDHEVRVAATGEKALENAETLGGVDLLITDVVMEPMDGFTLRDQLRAQYPALRTILITGYDLSDYSEQTAGWQLLQKPVSPETLVAAVEKELAAAAPAIPHAVAAPRVVAAAHATATPQARVSSPQVVATPRAMVPASPEAPMSPAASTVSAAPEASFTANGVASSTPEDRQESESDENLIGYMIGGYQIVSQLGEGRWGTVYAAVQTSINRPVGLKLLDPHRAQDEEYKQRFIAEARAKAAVQHPSILAVYEAGSADRWIFYTHEFVDGQNLQETAAAGRRLEEPMVLKILHTVGDGFLYLARNNIYHSVPEAGDIYVSFDGNPRMANLATAVAQQPTPEEEIRAVGYITNALISPETASEGLRKLVHRMIQGTAAGITGWGAVIQAVKALEPKIIPVEVAKISAQDRAASAALEAARRQQKRSFLVNVGSMAALILLVSFLVYWKFVRSNERRLDQQVVIPAGAFLFGDGTSMTLEEFDIDKYEVTIGQYAKFVEFIQKNAEREKDFDHPEQPRWITGHVPEDWDIYYLRARAGKPVHGVPTSLNSPMMMVSWWDAYAYAKWKGRELPSEAQWEKAARGTAGYKYPWGEEPEQKSLNSGLDFLPQQPDVKGNVDGFNYWGDVDEQDDDESPFGVYGMAGNVSEWTATWSPEQKPVIKGGNFTVPPQPMSAKITRHEAKDAQEHIGFRTVNRRLP